MCKKIAGLILAAVAILLLVKIPVYAGTPTVSGTNSNTSTYSPYKIQQTGSVTLQPMGVVDAPTNNATLKGQGTIKGWFLDGSGVSKVEVLVDGTVAGQANYGDARADVQRAYPQYNNGNAGFHYTLDTSKFTDGKHTIAIRETGANGRVTTIGERTVTFANIKGYVDKPLPGSTLSGTSNVSGWFLDASGVASIEVLVDGQAVGQAVYGDSRPDIQNAFPDFNNENAGYHYALDTSKFSNGNHTVSIRETAANGRVTTLGERSVTFANISSKGYLDKPSPGSTLSGTTNISGWFLDASGVANIEVLVDGQAAGQAVYGDSRPDILNAFPDYHNENAGYHYALDTSRFSDGNHTISIKETGVNGRVTTIGERTVTFANIKGYFDKPMPGSTLKGVNNVSGWFLDTGGVASIEVMVDGQAAGQAVYGDSRPDIQNAFPDYHNGNAGYHYALDTTKFSNGNHTISIKETSKNGRVTTIGERTVTFTNISSIGYLDNPASNSKLSGTTNVSGWFLDANGVSKIEVLIDGATAGQATYGDARADVQKAFPEFNNGTSGYHFLLDTTQYSAGKHTITIKETSTNGQINTLPQISVFLGQTHTVFLDPGHGGTDPGATAGGYDEKTLNLAVAKKVQTLLENRGYTVYMSRNDDTFIPLLDRSQMANDLQADIFVSIHTNSTGTSTTTASGIESYFYQADPSHPSTINAAMATNPDRIAKSKALANIIQDKMAAYTGANDRGASGSDFSVVRESAMPATLLEIGFINNPSERQQLITDSYQNKLASAIADGIDVYFSTY